MKILQLPDVLHEYLVHVIEKHAGSGIHPEEGLAVSKLWEATKNATHIPDEQIAKMAAAGAYTGQSVPGPIATQQELSRRIETKVAAIEHDLTGEPPVPNEV
jgi:hypothetical protein